MNLSALDERLFEAVRCGDIVAVRTLLNQGLDVNTCTERGVTPLHQAIGSRQKAMAKYLIKRGADMDAPANYFGDVVRPIFAAIRYSLFDLAEYMVERGANVNTQNSFGDTLLHRAILHSFKDWAKYLIAHGADMNARDEIGITPMDVALSRPIEFAIEMLLAGLPASDDTLSDELKVVKARIGKAMKQFLSPLELSEAQIFSVLRALPRIGDFVEQLLALKAFSLDDEFSITSFKRYIFKRLTEQGRPQEKEIANELILMIFDKLADVTMVERLIGLYQLELSIADHLLFDGQKHLEKYKTFYERFLKHDWRQGDMPLPDFEVHSQLATLGIS